MGSKIIPGLLGIGLEIGQVAEIHGSMVTDVPSGIGQEQEQQQVKIISREDPERSAGEEIQGYIPAAGVLAFFSEQDGRDQVTAQHKEERNESSHVDRKGDLQCPDPIV